MWQEAIFGNRHGVHLARQNMARWMGLAADWLRPIYEKIRTGVMAGGYLQIDETPIRYLSPGHGQAKLGYFSTALSPGGDVVKHVTPEAWAKASHSLQRQPLHSPIITVIARGYDIYVANIKSMSIGARRDAYAG